MAHSIMVLYRDVAEQSRRNGIRRRYAFHIRKNVAQHWTLRLLLLTFYSGLRIER
jgi:hypothetical protein